MTTTNIFYNSSNVKTDIGSLFATKSELSSISSTPSLISISNSGNFTYDTANVYTILVKALTSGNNTTITLTDTTPSSPGTEIYIILDNPTINIGYTYNIYITGTNINQSIPSTGSSWHLIRGNSSWLFYPLYKLTTPNTINIILLVWYKFEYSDTLTTSGTTTLYNYATGTRDATYTNTSTVAVDPAIYITNNQYKIGASSGYFNYTTLLTSSKTITTGTDNGISISVWFYISSTTDRFSVFSFSSGTSNTIFFASNGEYNLETTYYSPFITPSAANWHHVVFVMSKIGTTSYQKIYYDNVLYATSNQTLSSTVFNYPLIMGGRTWTSNNTPINMFLGYIDDVRVYQGALSASQVSSIYYKYS
jgi:hypothetical protein